MEYGFYTLSQHIDLSNYIGVPKWVGNLADSVICNCEGAWLCIWNKHLNKPYPIIDEHGDALKAPDGWTKNAERVQ